MSDPNPAHRASVCFRQASMALLMCLAVTLSGCAVSRLSATGDPQPPFAGQPGANALRAQSLVMSMADEYSAALGEAMYLLVRSEHVDPKGRWLAQSFLRNGMGAAIDIASGPNPGVGLLDLLVLGSLQSWAFEAHWIPAGIGATAGNAALERLKAAETALWLRSRRVLSRERAATLRQLIDQWIQANPDRTVVSLVRFDEFTDERRLPALDARTAASGLLADVQNATAAVEGAERLGERVLWFAGRLPYVLGQQAELTAYRIADQPEAALLRDATADLRTLVATLGQRARTLDADLSAQQTEWFSRLRAERVASLADTFGRLSTERKALFDDLESRQRSLGPAMQSLRATIEASGKLAQEMTGTVLAMDRVVARFDREPGDQRPPLDIKDVTATAVEATRAAKEMTLLLDRVQQVIGSTDLDARVERMEQVSRGLVDHVFWRAVWLLLLLLGGIALLRLLPGRRA